MKTEVLKKLIKHIIRESMTPYDVNVDDPGDFVLRDLIKLFRRRKPAITWGEIQNVGLRRIKDATKAMTYAQKLAFRVAKKTGYRSVGLDKKVAFVKSTKSVKEHEERGNVY